MDKKKNNSENEITELSADELDSVAGGRGGGHHTPPKAANPFAGEYKNQEQNEI